MPHGCKLEDLLALLHERAPAKVDALALNRRRVEHGLLSVGLKIHCLGDGRQFSTLVERLGGSAEVLEINMYKRSQASLCLVLPPVGNARSAIVLLECIEHFIGSTLFGNPKIQIQVCSPWRLSARRSALLAIGFYLGSDTLWSYTPGDFETTVSNDWHYRRGERLVIYDANGSFERDFEWWERARGINCKWYRISVKSSPRHLFIRPRLPFKNGRTDLLAASSKLDIENINLLASLLVHAEYQGCQGYWRQLGEQFEEDMKSLLDRHLLTGLVSAPWVRTSDRKTTGDDMFFQALQELVAYTFGEAERIRRASNDGILQEAQSLLKKYRSEIVRQSRLLNQGGQT